MTETSQASPDLKDYNLHPVIQDTAKRGLPIPEMPEVWVSRALVNPYYDDEIRAVQTVCAQKSADVSPVIRSRQNSFLSIFRR